MASNKDNKHKLPEGSGVNPKPIVTFLVVLTIATVAVYVIIKVMLWGFGAVDQMTAPAPVTRVETGVRKFPAEPRLQGAPEPDANNQNGKASLLPLEEMADYTKKIAAAEAAYGWVEGKNGVEARIPIEEAKKLIVERGLPVKSEALVKEIADAEKVRKQLNNSDASAGRYIGK
jgi:hypothetical protein